MKYIYDENGNLLAKKHQGTDEEFQMDYPEQKIYISDLDLGEKAIVEGEAIRAMTRLDRINERLEILQDGEYIKGKEIITIEKPNYFYIWVSKKKKLLYEKQFEIDFINSEILNKEIELNELYDILEKATARRLKALIADTQHKVGKITENIETLENRIKELEE